MLGIFALTAQGVEGAILQMINHGLSTGALFLLVGMLYERRHTRMIEDFGGLARIIPAFTAAFMLVTLSSIGLPGLNGFVGEFLILVGTFRVNVLYAVLATAGIILAAVYMLWMFQRVMFGPVTQGENRSLVDLTPREVAVLTPVLVLIVWIGIYPQPFLRTTEASVTQLLTQVQRGKAASAESQAPSADFRVPSDAARGMTAAEQRGAGGGTAGSRQLAAGSEHGRAGGQGSEGAGERTAGSRQQATGSEHERAGGQGDTGAGEKRRLDGLRAVSAAARDAGRTGSAVASAHGERHGD
jgi:hypothetical protein